MYPSIIPSKGGYDVRDCSEDKWATMSSTYWSKMRLMGGLGKNSLQLKKGKVQDFMWMEILQWWNNTISLLLMRDVHKTITQIEDNKLTHNQVWFLLSLDSLSWNLCHAGREKYHPQPLTPWVEVQKAFGKSPCEI